MVQSSPPPPPSWPPLPSLLPSNFFYSLVTAYGSYCDCVYMQVNKFSFPVSVWKEVLKPVPAFKVKGHAYNLVKLYLCVKRALIVRIDALIH